MNGESSISVAAVEQIGDKRTDSVEYLLSDNGLRSQLAYEISIDEFRHQSILTLNMLCTHSADGYEKTDNILEQYKVL